VVVFGDKYHFALGYKLKNNPFGEKGLVGESWGQFEMWVDGADICKYMRNHERKKYEWNLIYIMAWLNDHLEHILDEDPFPLPVKGKHAIELLKHSHEFDSDDDEEFDQWHDKKQEWEFKHSWFSCRAGSYLPYVCFRKVHDQIEIAWDNNDLYDDVVFLQKKGVKYVEINFFKQISCNMVIDFANNMLTKFPGDLKLTDVIANMKAILNK